MTRRWIPALAAAGAVLGAVAGLATNEPHRAATTLAAEVGGAPAAPSRDGAKPIMATLADLALGDVVTGNVAQAEHVPASRVGSRLHARVPAGTALLVLAYDASSAADAQRIVQQAASVFTSIVAARFGSGSRHLSIAVVEPARPVPGPPRPVLRDTLLGAVVGLLAGALLGARRRAQAAPDSSVPAEPPAAALSPEPKAAIRARVEAFAPAARPDRLGAERAAAAPAPPPPPPPEPTPPSAPSVAAEPPPIGSRGWNLDDLERRARAAGGPSLDERLAYVVALRPQARDGMLGVEYDAIVHDVFGELLE